MGPNIVEAWENLGTILYNIGKLDDSVLAYNKALEIFDKSANVSYGEFIPLYIEDDDEYKDKENIEILKAKVWYKRGGSLFKSGKYNDAINSYDVAIELYPEYYDAWINKGVALGELGEHYDAIKIFDKASKMDLNDESAFYNKGFALSKLGKFDDSIEAYNKALERNEQHEFSLVNKSVALNALNKFDDARFVLEKLTQKSPEYKDDLVIKNSRNVNLTITPDITLSRFLGFISK